MSVKALSIVGAARTSVERYPRELALAFPEVEQDLWAVADASCLDVDPQPLNSVPTDGFLGLAVQQVAIHTHDEAKSFQQLVVGRNEPV